MFKKSLTVAACTLAAAQTPALAGTANSTMLVSASVLESCTVLATPMLFGSVAPGSGNIDSSATLNLVCTPNADYDILLNGGAHASASQRRLANAGATEYIPYDLYMDSNRTQAWGNTVGTDTKTGVVGLIGIVAHQVYGRIPATATPVSAGSYTDTVTVTVNF